MSSLARVGTTGAAALALVLALTACVPEAETGAAATSSPSASATAAAPSPSPTDTAPSAATPSATSTPATALPASCDALYSDQMRATLDAQVPPLNDPGVTLLSSDQAPLLELLASVPTIRCTWGAPSEVGLSTNVSVIDAAQASTVTGALADAGFGCESAGDATICRFEQRGVSLDDKPYERGEVQAVSAAAGLWVSTSWLNIDPDGYTEDILATLTR